MDLKRAQTRSALKKKKKKKSSQVPGKQDVANYFSKPAAR